MHMCASTEADLGTSSDAASALKADMDAKVKTAKGLSTDMQNMGAKLQKSFGAVGDSGAAGLSQEAKGFAGPLVHKAEDAEEAAGKLGSLVKAASGLKGLSDPETVTKAERTMEDIDAAVAAGVAVTDALDKLTALASPSPTAAGAAKQYYPVMNFVVFKTLPTIVNS